VIEKPQEIIYISGSSPQQPGHDSSPKSSEGGRESRDTSPSTSQKGKHDLSSSAKMLSKARRKKPRNIYISPQKQRLLRQKQREREEYRRKVGLSDSMAGNGIPFDSIIQDQVNNAFEEDFGPLLRGEVVVVDGAQTPLNLVEAAVDLLLGTAMGGIEIEDIRKEDEDAANTIMREIDADEERDDSKFLSHVDEPLSPIIVSQNCTVDSSLQAPNSNEDRAKGGSPSYQLLAEAEKDCEKHDQTTEVEATSDSNPEARKITPLIKESVRHVPVHNSEQTDDEDGASCSESQSSASSTDELEVSDQLDQLDPEVLEDAETYPSRPIGRRLSLGPDGELQKQVARGNSNVPSRGGDVFMVSLIYILPMCLL
jgi:hypothetical protein